MLQIEGKAWIDVTDRAAQHNDHQIIFKLFAYDIFCNNLQHKKKLKANFEVSA